MKALALVAALTAVSASQADRASIAGSWTAQFEGRTFLRLELTAADGTITGGLTVGDIEVDEHGGLRHAGEPPRDLTPIFDVTEQASTVTFARKNGSDTDRWELRVLEPGRAELRLILTDADRQELAAMGVPPPKPIPLTKQ